MNTLNEKDIDQLTMMLVLNLLIAERCVQMTELFYQDQLRNSKDYEDLVKTKGKELADKACENWIHKTFRREAKWSINSILRIGQNFRREIENLYKVLLKTDPLVIPKNATDEQREEMQKAYNEATVKEMAAYDELQKDTSKFMWMLAAMNNITDSDEVKILSTLKLYATKGCNVRPELLSTLDDRIWK